jgi:hypothetical protein
MTSIVILAVISALGIGCLLVCLYGLHQAGKEQPVRRVLITRVIEVEQTLPKHQFGSALLSPAGERPTLRARVLQFPVPQSEVAAPAVSVNIANGPASAQRTRTGSAGEVRYRRFDQ